MDKAVEDLDKLKEEIKKMTNQNQDKIYI